MVKKWVEFVRLPLGKTLVFVHVSVVSDELVEVQVFLSNDMP